MKAQQDSSEFRLFALSPLSGEADAANGAFPQVIARVSTLQAGASAIAPANCFLALVLITEAPINSVTVSLPDTSRIDSLQRAGDLCLLPPRSAVHQRPVSEVKIIRYEIPALSIRAFAPHDAAKTVASLKTPHIGSDPILHFLSRVVQPALDSKDACSSAFAEHFTVCLFSHLIEHYGERRETIGHFVGGLSPRHKRIVEQALLTSFDVTPDLNSLSEQCGLSRRHFARAFRQSFGVPFYRHLLNSRIIRAKRLLLETDLPLNDIARGIGYADQATFTESFTRAVRCPPGRFRRRFLPDNHAREGLRGS